MIDCTFFISAACRINSLYHRYDTLYRYRIVTDMWEDMDPLGVKEVKRFAFNYQMVQEPVILHQTYYDAALDHPDAQSAIVATLCPTCGAVYMKRPFGGNLPHQRGDSAMDFYRSDSTLILFGGFSTEWGYPPLEPGYFLSAEQQAASDGTPLPSVARNYTYDTIDPGFERTRYYYDDTWTYAFTPNLWIQHHYNMTEARDLYPNGPYDTPMPRRGHTIVVRRQLTGDAQVIMYGGQHQDEPLSDLWTYDIERDVRDRKWQQLDNTFVGATPGKIAFHTSVWSEELNEMITFGGITWTQTDLNETDTARDRDRRCFKVAKDLPTTYQDTAMAQQYPNEEPPLQVLLNDPEAAMDLVRHVKQNCAVRQLCCDLANIFPEPLTLEEQEQWNKHPDVLNNDPQCQINWDPTICRYKTLPTERLSIGGTTYRIRHLGFHC